MFASGMGLAKLLVVSAIGAGLPFGLPPEKEDSLMSRVAPDECLAYVSWAGSSEPNGKSENHLEQLLAEPEVQFFLTEVKERILKGLDEATLREGPEAEFAKKEILKWGKRLLSSPGALFVSKLEFTRAGPIPHAGLVVGIGDDGAELQALLKKVCEEILGRDAVKEVKVGGATMYRMQLDPNAPAITLGIKDKYFYAGVGEGVVAATIERASTEPPAWLSKLRKQLPVERPSIVTYGNTKALIEMAKPYLLLAAGPDGMKMLDALGVGNIDALASVSGLDESGFVTRALIGLDGEPKGILGAAIGKPLAAADLDPIPRDATLAVAARMDAGKMFDTILETVGKFNPELPDEIRQEIGEAEEELGFRIRDHLFGSLGDVWCLYHSPGEGGLLAGFAAVVRVKDRERLEGVMKKLMDQAATAAGVRRFRGRRGVEPPKLLGQLKFAGHDIHFLNPPDDDFFISPAWCLADKELIFSPFPQNIKAYLSRGDDYQSLAKVPGVAEQFQSTKPPIKLVYQNTPELFELAYPFVQILGTVFTGDLRRNGIDVDVSILPSGSSIKKHLRPDVTSVAKTSAGLEITCRQSLPGSGGVVFVPAIAAFVAGTGLDLEDIVDGIAFVLSPSKAREQESLNRLRQFGLAMHNFHDVYKILPAAYSTNAEGKPLLSWRVQILPFIEHEALYREFHLDEPWDSEHNRKLIAKMPEFFRAPGSKAGPGKTTYLAIGGKGGCFQPPRKASRVDVKRPNFQGTSFAQITDGLSNTIWLVEASDKLAVEWTKPTEFKPNDMNPLAGLIGLRKRGFLAGFGDGSVRKVVDSADKEVVKRAFGRNDGKAVD